MAFGKVLVSHPHNSTGIFNKDSAPILLAREPEDYVSHIKHLFQNRDELLRLKMRTLDYISELNEHVKSQFKKVIEETSS